MKDKYFSGLNKREGLDILVAFYKGQLISEWLFDLLNFPKKQ